MRTSLSLSLLLWKWCQKHLTLLEAVKQNPAPSPQASFEGEKFSEIRQDNHFNKLRWMLPLSGQNGIYIKENVIFCTDLTTNGVAHPESDLPPSPPSRLLE